MALEYSIITAVMIHNLQSGKENKITFEAQHFFYGIENQSPNKQAAILWLSPKMFTASCDSDKEFVEANGAHDESFLSIGELYKKYFIMGSSKIYEPLQYKKFDKIENEPHFRPYLVFYNEPTNCTWAIPLSTSYSFLRNPYNESFFYISEELYKYVYTNIKKRDDVVAEPTMAFPIAANMAIFKQNAFNKYERSQFLDAYISDNFVNNDEYKASAFEVSKRCYTTSENENLFYTSASYGFFLLNAIYKQSNLANQLAKTYTVESNIPLLESSKKVLAGLASNAKKLEQLLYYYIRAKVKYNEDPNSVKLTTEMFYFCTKISELTPKIQQNFVDLGIKNISAFPYDIKFANEFTNCCENAKRSSFAYALKNLENSEAILNDAIAQINSRAQDAKQAAINEIKTQEMISQYQKRQEERKNQSEKDKQKNIQRRFDNARELISELMTFHRSEKNNNIDEFIRIADSINEDCKQLKNDLMFLTLEHEDPFVNTIISTIIKNEPDIVQYGQEIIDLYELTSKQLSECNIDELYKIRTIAKNKTIRNDDLSEEDIAFLTNDLDRTKKIIQETNSNIGFAKELLPYLSFFDSSIKDSLKEITDKMAELQSAQIKKQELASIVFGDCITSIKVDDFDLNNEIITVTNFKTKEELISALSSINRKIASAISNERQTISRLKSISAAKDRVLEYEKQIEKVKSMSDSELAQLLKDYAAEHLHMPVENQNDGAVEFQSKVFTAAIGLLPKNGEIIPTGDSLESIMDSYEEIAGKRTEILSKILAIPNSFCEFESNLQTLSDCVDRQFENLRLADGSIISNKLLIMAMATLPENEKDAATEEITCLLMQKVYDHCEGKTSKSTAMISPKFKLPRSKEIGGSIPRFCTQQKDINDDFKTITDIIATAWPVFIISSLAKTTEELPNPELFIKGEYPLIKTPEKSYSPINGFLDTLDSLLDLCSAYREMYTSQRVDNYFKSMSNDLRNDMQFQLSIIEIIKNVASRTSLKALLDAIAEMTELKPKLARAHGDRQKKAELTERYNNLIDLIALKLKIEGERAKIIRPQDS